MNFFGLVFGLGLIMRSDGRAMRQRRFFYFAPDEFIQGHIVAQKAIALQDRLHQLVAYQSAGIRK